MYGIRRGFILSRQETGNRLFSTGYDKLFAPFNRRQQASRILLEFRYRDCEWHMKGGSATSGSLR